MSIDNHAKSSQLLQRLANSIAERNPVLKDFCFNAREVQVVEVWLKETVDELSNGCEE